MNLDLVIDLLLQEWVLIISFHASEAEGDVESVGLLVFS